MDEVLKIKELRVSFKQRYGNLDAVRGVSLSVRKGEILALVGESGCGKSVTAKSVLKLNDVSGGEMTAEELWLGGRDILAASEREMLEIRGKLAGMIFQDPLTYLNPTMKVGKQVTETLRRHGKKTSAECRSEAVRLLEMVQIPEASLRAEQYPHQFSGGMRQRAMIAMALACSPVLLIADEPTTALDPTIQMQILALLKKMQTELHTSVLMITHDLSVVANVADKVAVMYAGKIVEESDVGRLFEKPAHPYTRGLIESLPNLEKDKELRAINGAPPDLDKLPQGCSFAPRCEACLKICHLADPPEIEIEDGHRTSCWLYHRDNPEGGYS